MRRATRRTSEVILLVVDEMDRRARIEDAYKDAIINLMQILAARGVFAADELERTLKPVSEAYDKNKRVI